MEASYKSPHTLSFQQIGDSAIGYISVAEGEELPFDIQRVFWTYYTPHEVERGGHAHERLEEICVAVNGTIKINTTLRDGSSEVFTLDSPNTGLYLPPFCWRTLEFSHNAVLMTMASIPYDVNEYIRDYDQFMDQ